MQVLVALARNRGRVISRDELVEACWESRAVSEDAIHRVLSRLRQVAADIGGASFSIQTIRGVGYRLIEGSHELRSGQTLMSRRVALASATAGLGATVFAGSWLLPGHGHQALPLAMQYYERGMETRGQASLEQTQRGMAFFREAVRIDPQYADAWGALAWVYGGVLRFGPRADSEKWISLCRSAARRALELDPDNSDAQAALLLLKPFFRNWLEIERGLRGLIRKHPHDSILEYNLAYTLAEVGRWRDSIPLLRSVAQRERFWPLPVGDLALALFAIGEDEEADDLTDDGMKRFPGRIDFWLAKVRYLITGGRYSEAMSFVSDPGTRPANQFEPIISYAITLVGALANGSSEAIDAAALKIEALARSQVGYTYATAAALAMLGKIDASFSVFEGLYLGRGPWAANLQVRPVTAGLFGRWTAKLRSDPRFWALTSEIGLEDYWRSSGTLPDYRRYR